MTTTRGMTTTAEPHGLVDLLGPDGATELAALLADDVTFSSPVADYHGKADVLHLLGLIGQVLDHRAATGVSFDGATRLTSIDASVRGERVEGIIRERHDARGRLTHATLFLRPLRSLHAAVGAMAELLAQSPLPSAMS